MLVIFSRGILKIPYLSEFLNRKIQPITFLSLVKSKLSSVAVWGYRPSGNRAIHFANKNKLPVIYLEDGFLRSFGLGVNGVQPLSIVVDEYGIYYDATKPSGLELLIKDCSGNESYYSDAEQAITLICRHNLSKYNQAPDFIAPIEKSNSVVLVLDQTFNDMAIRYGGANENTFSEMLVTAITENPNSSIWVKVHPDVLTGKKRGYLAESALNNPRVTLFTDDVSPLSLLRQVNKVYVVTSQMGFEALLVGKSVVTFGLPWYAGWGLTDDRHPDAIHLANRRGKSSLLNLFAATYFRYCRYINPATGKKGSIFDVINTLVIQREFHHARRGRLYVPGLTLWKRAILTPYLISPLNTVSFSRPRSDGAACVVWGIKGEHKWKENAEQASLAIWHMEDGFLRSVGLGSDLNPPLSLVLDKTGIYYDATRPSDLENILNSLTLSENDLLRVKNLQEQLVNLKLSKYNVGRPFSLPALPINTLVILVPGQVEDDASILTGAPRVNTNYGLLSAVRHANPNAFIVYKPHPDVLAGNRKGAITSDKASSLADLIAIDADIIDCIQKADEVHTMTSLSGFEALLHGKKVVCYGLPFYAGWGLTTDMLSIERRRKKLTLAELLFGAYIQYPTYINPSNANLLTVEQAIEWLQAQPRCQHLVLKGPLGYLQRQTRKLRMLSRALFRKAYTG